MERHHHGLFPLLTTVAIVFTGEACSRFRFQNTEAGTTSPPSGWVQVEANLVFPKRHKSQSVPLHHSLPLSELPSELVHPPMTGCDVFKALKFESGLSRSGKRVG
eukprot:214961-Rhodomonas_salina.1